MLSSELPHGQNPPTALSASHFPTSFQAVLWRNWGLVPLTRLTQVLGCDLECLQREASALGLPENTTISPEWETRGYITIIRRNWHLLPYEQLLELLDWPADRLLRVLQEDDFLWIKLGSLKPQCETVRYRQLTHDETERTTKIRLLVESEQIGQTGEPPFQFVRDWQRPRLPVMRQARTQKTDEIKLDSTWTIRYPENSRYLKFFASRFASNHDSRWGFLLALEPNSERPNENERHVLLELCEMPGQRSESHEVEVKAESVAVRAADETGILRGLQWLERAMEKSGGPYLSPGKVRRNTVFDSRFLHSYLALCGDVFLEQHADPIPDGLLAELADRGVNGIWFQGLLYSLYPWHLAPGLGEGYEKRLAGLRNLCERAARWGIGIYLYANEPRGLPESWFELYPGLRPLRGVSSDVHDSTSLCTSLPEVQDFLRDGMTWLFTQVPELAGIFTITMSENLTSCASWPMFTEQCPRCRERPEGEVVAEVNRLLAEGVYAAKPSAKVIAWTWGWSNFGDAEQLPFDWHAKTLAGLHKDTAVMATSEERLPIEIGGVKSRVLDYTMSQVGPSPNAIAQWKMAEELGLQTIAKVQVNNTWECSTVPCLPVPDLVEKHLQRLEEEGVSGLMLSWTTGGYPSANLELAERFYWKEEQTVGTNKDSFSGEMDTENYGPLAPFVRRAHEYFAEAFPEFPFHFSGLYYSPQNIGPANLLYAEPTGYTATAVCFPYDDLQTWRSAFTEEVYRNQWGKLCAGWKSGLDELDKARAAIENAPQEQCSPEPRARLRQLTTDATAAYLHFRSCYLQVAYIIKRDRLRKDGLSSAEAAQIRGNIHEILSEEIELARSLGKLMQLDSKLGFEASNHYFYTQQDLLEKIISCHHLQEQLSSLD